MEYVILKTVFNNSLFNESFETTELFRGDKIAVDKKINELFENLDNYIVLPLDSEEILRGAFLFVQFKMEEDYTTLYELKTNLTIEIPVLFESFPIQDRKEVIDNWIKCISK